MCGRFALTSPHEQVAEIFDATPDPDLSGRAPRHNICPTQPIEVVHTTPNGRTIQSMRWGFVPHWFKTLSSGPLLINARAETLASKPAFADAARKRRCLIPATGFFEWETLDGPKGKPAKKPYWVHPAPNPASNMPVVAFGGVWQDWVGPDGASIRTAAIITTAASKTLTPLHHRAPLAIAPADWPLWLGEAGHGAARLMAPPEETFWSFHPVAPEIGKASADGPHLMAPVEDMRLL